MNILGDLNEPQRQAVMHVHGPLLILAGAGSGKTRVITRRVAYLIEQGVPPWQILAITFTNKAAKEMVDRIAALGVPQGVTACTFHSLCARLLREFADLVELSPQYSIYDTLDQKRLVKLAIEQAGLPGYAVTPGAALHVISRAKMRLQDAAAFEREAALFADRQMAKVYRAYEGLLAAASALDFDDLLLRVALLLSQHPEIRRLLGQRYGFVLIDEYQDTNHAQYVIAHGIALEHENICATGDPDQSIYSWRGANIGNILEFEQDYANATVIRLEENYRSTPQILAVADRLIGHNRRRKAKTLFTRRPGGPDVNIIAAADEHAEAAEVVRRVRCLAGQGVRHDDMAVFYRLNSLSRVVEDAFRKAGLPYRIARGVAFYNRKEIKDVLAYLKLMLNPRDDLACERIINVPSRGIGATTLMRLREHAAARGLGLLAAAGADGVEGLGKAAAHKVAGFAALIAELAGQGLSPVQAVLERVLTRTGLEQELRSTGSEDRCELANVEELVTSAAEFDRDNPSATLADYLHLVSLVSDVDRFEGGTGAVTLMTLHAAKGLEFPAVFIVGCEEGILPFHRPGEMDSDEEEERRLCFVGVTRAKEHLAFFRARYRGLRGSRQRQAPSAFLAELDGPSVQHVDLGEPHFELMENEQDRGEGRQDAAGEAPDPIYDDDGFYDPQAPAPAAAGQDEANGTADTLPPGRRVRHPKFGQGRIIRTGRSGPYSSAVIDFDHYGRKTVILQFARLELLS